MNRSTTLRSLATAWFLLLGVAAPAHAGYLQINLVSNIPGAAAIPDANLVNPWGLAAGPTSPFWAADNGTGVSTLYNGNSPPTRLPLVVSIPPAAGSLPGTLGTPTGIVFNGSTNFQLDPSGSHPALFLFATEDGTIAGWNPNVPPPPPSTQALRMVQTNGASYKGLAIDDASDRLYAANFGQGSIDVFDAGFNPLSLPGAFQDPTLPSGFSPFNVQNIGGDLFVTYAKVQPGSIDEVDGPGLGFVDAFDANGNFLRRFASDGTLDAPWGLALAPANFGAFSHALLVGNFGDGRINAFNFVSGLFLGQLADPSGQPITIDGLWGLRFGNDHAAGPSDALFFNAGIDGESDGLFGKIVAVPEPRTLVLVLLALVLLPGALRGRGAGAHRAG